MPKGGASMQIKTTSGSGAGALGIIGTGLALALPDAKWIGWTLVAVGLLVFVFDVHIERGQLAVASRVSLRKRLRRMWPQYVMVLGGGIFFFGLVALLQSSAKSTTDHPDTLQAVDGPNPLDRTVSFNCYGSTRPTHFREDRPLHVVQIARPSVDPELIRAAIANTWFVQGTEEIKWPDDYPDQVYKCILTNHGNAPLFRASVELAVTWINSIKTENGTKSGDVIATYTAQSPAIDLGVSSKNEDYFYLVNLSEGLVSIPFPKTATVFSAGTDNPQKIKLIPPTTMVPEIALFPPAPKSLPAPPPPTPTPPNTPEKK
jgi:hypothetical protein